jgi:hypothetical protein
MLLKYVLSSIIYFNQSSSSRVDVYVFCDETDLQILQVTCT